MDGFCSAVDTQDRVTAAFRKDDFLFDVEMSGPVIGGVIRF
jgi:hypothetical protein